jgi:membrane protease YdiL (CAAX protease family)
VVLLSLLTFEKWYTGDTFKQILRNLGFGKTLLTRLVPGIIICVVLILLYPLLGFLLHAELSLHADWLLNLAGLCLTGGLAEELFFRGFLFRHLREKMTFKKAVFVSMLLFTIAHLLLFTYMEWPIALSATVLAVSIAVPLAYLFENADNTVWAPALVHTTVRTVGLVITTSEEHMIPLALAWMAACMIVPYVVLLFFKDFRKLWTVTSN